MQKKNSFSLRSKYRVAPVTPQEIPHISRSAKWKNERDIQEQFLWSAKGGECGLTRCFVLIDCENELYLGFLGLTMSIEDLIADVYAYVSVEFVYLHATVRRNRLSRLFIKNISKELNSWLDDEETTLSVRRTVLYSISNPKSDEGRSFILRLDTKLSLEASSRGFEFLTSVDKEN
jgi:hypothetical protein